MPPQQQFVDLGQKGMDAGRQGLMQGAGVVGGQVEKGMVGVQALAFGGGAALVFIGIFGCFAIATNGVVEWIINFYQIAFGIGAMLVEGSEMPMLKQQPKAVALHAKLVEYAKFMTLLFGRGIFYIFVGSLTISVAFTTPIDWLQLLIGIFILFVGILCCGMHFNPAATQAMGAQYARPGQGPPAGYP